MYVNGVDEKWAGSKFLWISSVHITNIGMNADMYMVFSVYLGNNISLGWNLYYKTLCFLNHSNQLNAGNLD